MWGIMELVTIITNKGKFQKTIVLKPHYGLSQGSIHPHAKPYNYLFPGSVIKISNVLKVICGKSKIIIFKENLKTEKSKIKML